jgi:elongation factor Ts
MSSPTAQEVKALRDQTGAGMMDAKRALQEAAGDIDKAVELLRVKGQAQAAKRGEREASEGVVANYIHSNDKIGVLVEVNCETDFVARNEDFKEFARDVALHIAAAAPICVTEDEVPADDLDRERHVFEEQAADKPDEIRAKIVDGRINKWLEEVVLLRQKHVNQDKYDGQTIAELVTATAAKTGENVQIRRFTRFVVGE